MSSRPTRVTLVVVLAGLALGAAPARALEIAWTGLGGWQGGGVLRVTAATPSVVATLPLSFELGVGHAFVDPGDAALARRVFINDGTNGAPEKSGGVWDFRLDAAWAVKAPVVTQLAWVGGVRYSMYSGRFKYVGGNEDFTITSDAWGIGVGARASLAITKKLSVTAMVGLDWFPSQTLYGHDSSYSSNGDVVNNGQNDNGRPYGWRDADKAINQPWLLPSVLVGMTWRP